MTSVQEAVYGKACSPVERRLIGAGLNPKAHLTWAKTSVSSCRAVGAIGGFLDRYILKPNTCVRVTIKPIKAAILAALVYGSIPACALEFPSATNPPPRAL